MTEMVLTSDQIDNEVRKAVQRFWRTRTSQARSQGSASGVRDAGARAAVTGGAQMDGFTELLRKVLENAGVGPTNIHHKKKMEIPGWYRAEKNWDLLVVANGHLVAGMELKSQVGPSFGNNFNNRAEEAIGNATDLWAAYREGAFKPSSRPWLGYLMLLEEAPKSMSAVHVREPHFAVFAQFKGASYAKRYELLLTKLVRERLYDAACFLLSGQDGEETGGYTEPSDELSFRILLNSLVARATTIVTGR